MRTLLARYTPSVKNRPFRRVPGPGIPRDDRSGTHPSATRPGPTATHRPENGCGSAIDRAILPTLLGETAAAVWGLRVRTARLFNVVGAGMPARFFFPTLAERIRAASAGGAFPLRNSAATRDFIHVADVAEAVATLLDDGIDDGVYNVATGVETSIIAAASFLGMLAGGLMPVPEGPDARPLRSVGDATRLRGLSWTPIRTWQEAPSEVWQDVSRVA